MQTYRILCTVTVKPYFLTIENKTRKKGNVDLGLTSRTGNISPTNFNGKDYGITSKIIKFPQTWMRTSFNGVGI